MATSATASFGINFGKLVLGESSSWTSTDDDHSSIRKTGQDDQGAAVDIGNLANVGGIFIMNLSSAVGDNLLVSLDGGTDYDITILPGRFAFIPQPGGTVFAKAAAGKTVNYLAAAFEI